jgi:hypothetical protein
MQDMTPIARNQFGRGFHGRKGRLSKLRVLKGLAMFYPFDPWIFPCDPCLVFLSLPPKENARNIVPGVWLDCYSLLAETGDQTGEE